MQVCFLCEYSYTKYETLRTLSVRLFSQKAGFYKQSNLFYSFPNYHYKQGN